MAQIYYLSGSELGKRDTTNNPVFTQTIIDGLANTIVYFGNTGSVNALTGAFFFVSCSYAQSTSFCNSASQVLSSSFASQSYSASFALVSHLADTASFSLIGFSSSYALVASSADNATTASFASVSITASYGIKASNSDTASFAIYTQSGSFALASHLSDTASYSSIGISSSFALTSISSSFALIAHLADSASYSANALSSSYTLNALSSSFSLASHLADTASYSTNALTSSFGLIAHLSDSASYATNALTSSYGLRASNADSSSFSSRAITSSFGLNAANADTASFGISASNAISAAWAPPVVSPSSSYASFASSASFAIGSHQSDTSISSSYATSGLSASYAINGQSASFALSSHTTDTASFSSRTISSSFALAAHLADSASYSTNTLSSSFALSSGNSDTSSFALTASVVIGSVVSASFATKTISSSFALSSANSDSSSYASVGLSASYALNASAAGSASFASRTITSSFSSNSANADTASFSSRTISSSFALSTHLADSASYSTNALSSSFALAAHSSDTATSASFATAVHLADSASYSTNALTSSFALASHNSDNATSASFAQTASFALNAGGTGTSTGPSSQSMWDLMIPAMVLAKNFTQSAYQIAGGFIDDYWDTSSVGILGPFMPNVNSISNLIANTDTSVKLLLHFSGSSGSQATTDSGPYNLPVLFSGTTAITNTDFEFGGSSLLNPNNGFASVSGSQLWISASVDFTLEFWIKMLDTGVSTPWQWASSRMEIIRDSGGRLYLQLNPDIATETAGSVLTNDGAWHHIAVVRFGTGASNVQMYLDGTSILNGTTNMIISGSDAMLFGVGNFFMDEVRYCNVAKYTANFTPPVIPFTYSTSSVSTGSMFSTYRGLDYTASKAWLVSPVQFASGTLNNMTFAVTRDSGSSWTTCSMSNVATFNQGGNMYASYADLSAAGTGSGPMIGYSIGAKSGSVVNVYGAGLVMTK